MDKNITLIGNLRTEWIKYEEYEIKLTKENEHYICPKEGSKFTIYDPFEKSNELLLDVIDLGDKAISGEIGKEDINNLVIEFAKKYGLLGVITSSVYNRDIIGESKVLITSTNILKSKDKIMDEDDYISMFIPFAKQEEVYLRKLGKHMTLFKAEDSPKFYGKRPLILDLVFSKYYCERVDWIVEFAKNISTHINQTLVYKNIKLTESVTIMAGKFKAENIGLSVAVLDSPYIEWDFDSLKVAIEVIYSFTVADSKNTLKRCENCKKVFIAKNDNEKYCSKVCRNRYNVNKSRNKAKS